MSNLHSSLKDASNAKLLEQLSESVRRDRACEATLIAILGEVDARRLYLAQACSSMFDYCVRVLCFAEGVAYKRIAVARAGRRHPELLSALVSGEIHLTAACLIAPHLSESESESTSGSELESESGESGPRGHGSPVDGSVGGDLGGGGGDCRRRSGGHGGDVDEWLALARYATTREIKQRIADRKPTRNVGTSVRRLPVARTAKRVDSAVVDESESSRRHSSTSTSTSRPRPNCLSGLAATSAPAASAKKSCTTLAGEPKDESPGHDPERDRARVRALGAERYAIRVVVDQRVHEQLEELRALLRHSIPDGDVAKILARSIGDLLDRVRKQTFGKAANASAGGRRTRDSKRAGKPKASSKSKKESKKGGKPRTTRTPPPTTTKQRPKPSESSPRSRHIPIAIRRAVWARDDGRCAFASERGRRCEARSFVEFHHRVPWAHLGEHSIDNISLRCRAHNQFEAEIDFGAEEIARFRR